MQHHLQNEVLTERVPGVLADFDSMGVGSNSAGADTSVYLGANYPHLFKVLSSIVSEIVNGNEKLSISN